MEEASQILAMIAALVPDWAWPYADRFFTTALPWVIGAAALVYFIDKADMRDGRRDWPIVGRVAPYVSIVLEFALALLAVVGVKLPSWKDLAKFRELVVRLQMLWRGPSSEDVRGDR